MLNVMKKAESLRSNKENEVLQLLEIARNKIQGIDDLFCIAHYEDKARYSQGCDNYNYIFTNRDRTRLVLIEMNFSIKAFIKISDNGVLTTIDYIQL